MTTEPAEPADPAQSADPSPRGAVGLVAVVLAGGRANRLGDDQSKAVLELDGRTLLDHALAAVVDAGEVVVVGESEPTPRRVRFTVEEPRWSGPAAAVLAGLDALPAVPAETADAVAVLAVDMPRVTAGTVRRLHAARLAAPGSDGAVLVDEDGRRQLALVLDRAALARVRPAPDDVPGSSLHRLLAGLDLVEVPGQGEEPRDVDTWEDLRALREHASDHPG